MHALDKRQIRRSGKNYTGPNLAGPKCTGEGEGSSHPVPRPGWIWRRLAGREGARWASHGLFGPRTEANGAGDRRPPLLAAEAGTGAAAATGDVERRRDGEELR